MKKYLPLALGVLAISGCIAASSVGADSSKREESVYYKSQAEADAALAAFDKANPTCQLWTNWQKMCSRTGEKGATYCQKAQASVRPSVPFCTTNGELDESSDIDYSALQLESYLRFCSKKTGEVFNNIPACIWLSNRPFSGLNIQEQKHPWCKAWRKLSQSETGYICDKPAIPSWCERALGMLPLYRVNERPLSDEKAEAMFMSGVLAKANSVPVNRPYCDRRRANATK
ncbi:MAG: hypothetical protein ACRCY3_16300 [Sphingorhabdus sp.]